MLQINNVDFMLKHPGICDKYWVTQNTCAWVFG